MKRIILFSLFPILASAQNTPDARTQTSFQPLHITGRGECSAANGILTTKEAYASFGDGAMTDYEFSFSARTPINQPQVQIWAGFRARDRQDYYSFGFRGGEQNSLYLARRGYMGRDEFLALRPLGFHPVPGAWYDFHILLTGDRIRVFLGDEKVPRIDITDKNSRLLPSGQVFLGGGWLTTEYTRLKITPASNITTAATITALPAEKNKEQQRRTERAAYTPLKLTTLTGPRTELSLDGRWLFFPTYEGISDDKAAATRTSDDNWYTMPVPSFWNPIRIWLHGETFGPHAKGASDNYFQQETDRCEAYSFDYKRTSQAWYRQWLELPANIKGKSCELVFDAISKVAEVYINGKLAGSHVGMFGDFRVDGTGLFVPGKNLIAVKVSRDYGRSIADADKIVDVAVSVPVTNKMVHDLPHGFYGGDPAGIWQPVKLIVTNPIKITDVFIHPALTGATIDVTIKNTTDHPADLHLSTAIPTLCENAQRITIPAATEQTYTVNISNIHPKLWSPQEPNLYNFTFQLLANSSPIDQTTVVSGFRTFESHDGYFWLNNRKYWLRGANQTPFALEPDSPAIADHFFQLMKAANMEITRTHTSPYNETWVDAADRNGIGISYEGTWPWLMLAGSMPDSSLITLWADEFIGLLKKYRNHPSLLLWTVNNEMKFYDNDPDPARARVKMRIISEVVKRMRQTDPTRPICFDSNYRRNTKKFGEDFFTSIDDGDIDDVHAYYNWYDYSIFRQFKGEFQTQYRNQGRPLISQEMSTGYPNAETGHATRFYTIVHQTPQSLIGDLAYENANPEWFLKTHAFITGELAEAFRRSDDKASGFLHFALLTWFRNVYNQKTIEPYPVYYAMKRALQPVLVSAELWGRHFYAGRQLPVKFCIVNDAVDGKPIPASTLDWQLTDTEGHTLTTGRLGIPETPYYGRQWLTPEITIPSNLPHPRTEAQLRVRLSSAGTTLSTNQYDITLATRQWSAPPANTTPILVDFSGMRNTFDSLRIPYIPATIDEALTKQAPAYVFAGLKPDTNCTPQQLTKLKTLITSGAHVLLLDAPAAAKALYPASIRGWIVPTEGEVANLEIPESPVFDGIEPLDLRYFNDNRREMPSVCHAALQIQPGPTTQTSSTQTSSTQTSSTQIPTTQALAAQMRIHGYVEGDMDKRAAYMEKIKGFPIVKIDDGGTLLVSTMSLEKAATDPIAGRLLTNMILSLNSDKPHPSHTGTSSTPHLRLPSDTIAIELSKRQLHPGDTLSFSCDVPSFARDSTVGSLHLVLENIHTHRRWQYRYPIINGSASGDLVVGGGIDDGNYAVNFVVQSRFFRVEGKVKDYRAKMSPLTYVVMIRNKPGFIERIVPDPDGTFRLKPAYIEDTAYYVFSPAKKEQSSALYININTPLDSTFKPFASATKFITVASQGDSIPLLAPSNYHFDINKLSGPGVLQTVTVTGTKKSAVDRFNEEYSTGLFRNNAYMTFDGLGSDAIAKSFTIYDFLRFQIPGFTATPNNEGGYTLRWRNTGVNIFLDEFPLLHPEDVYIDPNEVAMIKVYQPPNSISNRTGVIAVYTKRGDYDKDPRRKNKFKVAGYSAPVADWQ